MDTRTGEIIEFPGDKNPDINRYRGLPIGHIETIAGWPCKLTAVNIETQQLTFTPLSQDEKDEKSGLPQNFREKIDKLRNL